MFRGREGDTSLNGAGVANSGNTAKVIDVGILSRYRTFPDKLKGGHTDSKGKK
jgi:hypothetical protein